MEWGINIWTSYLVAETSQLARLIQYCEILCHPTFLIHDQINLFFLYFLLIGQERSAPSSIQEIWNNLDSLKLSITSNYSTIKLLYNLFLRGINLKKLWVSICRSLLLGMISFGLHYFLLISIIIPPRNVMRSISWKAPFPMIRVSNRACVTHLGP